MVVIISSSQPEERQGDALLAWRPSSSVRRAVRAQAKTIVVRRRSGKTKKQGHPLLIKPRAREMSFALLLAAVAYTAPYGRTPCRPHGRRAASVPAAAHNVWRPARLLSRTPSKWAADSVRRTSSSASSTGRQRRGRYRGDRHQLARHLGEHRRRYHPGPHLVHPHPLGTARRGSTSPSRTLCHPDGRHPALPGGAQNIIGFDFCASLTMDMVELVEEGATRPTRILRPRVGHVRRL